VCLLGCLTQPGGRGLLHLAVGLFEAREAAVHRCHCFIPSRWACAIATICEACAERLPGSADSGASGFSLSGFCEVIELDDGP